MNLKLNYTKIDSKLLSLLCKRYNYAFRDNGPIIFAIRSSLPVSVLQGNFKTASHLKDSHHLYSVNLDYKTPRCTIGIWDVQKDKVALFPGSTVPSKNYLLRNPNCLSTFNMLCPGFYELRKGTHPRNEQGFQRHDAFLMDHYGMVCIPGIKRTKFSLAFLFANVKYKIILPGDNLHAARIEPISSDNNLTNISTLQMPFSSSGCMVIVGQPKQYVKHRAEITDWNSWETFMELIEKLKPSKAHYGFILFNYSDLMHKNQNSTPKNIRYGSQGEDVSQVQFSLKSIINSKTGLSYYQGEIDGMFLKQTATSYLRFQEDFIKRRSRYETTLGSFLNDTKHFYLPLERKQNAIY